MITNYQTSDFTLIEGKYYSPSFKINKIDDLVTIEVRLNEQGTINIQSSIDGLIWYTVPYTSFICNINGLQSYKECHPELYYRIESSHLVNLVKILI